ncbi:kynureninase [Rhodalgimonas zhirmunskyi]|uniref:Kynureninase n=1 Tax=Rhodalgimonas zhirmunskyi TaxID=2964767 RepID=A0AAJ1UDB6_9RHOB|nr:kynureninase [Rhodoalgimonas zhirmunskyi]MDQ2095418.1 kynureninase [Rhodoalgimonas zhirmunskyi]
MTASAQTASAQTDFAHTKQLFHLPEGVIYLDGNSLGPLPLAAPIKMQTTMRDEWGEMLITGWNKAGWMAQPTRVGDRIARLIGAEDGHVVIGDTLSIKVYQALASALELNPDRKVILSDSGNFPTDLYMAEGLIKSLGQGHELRIVAPEEVEDAITEEVAVTLITEVDYRTGRLHDMKALTEKAHAVGALTIWDLAHSAGALPVDLAGVNADFAVGCTYKYLNGGPGAPAFIYVAPRHADKVEPALSGWLGHDAPFEFERSYRPGPGIERMRVGTPPVLALSALESALDIWDMTTMQAIREKSQALTALFIEEVETRCPMLTLASPRDAAKRGSQVSFRFPDGYAAMQALIARGVIGDFRAPDIMRFGFTPLYIDEGDVTRAAAILEEVMTTRAWDAPEYKARSRVT